MVENCSPERQGWAATGLGEEDLGGSDLDDGDDYRESPAMVDRPEEEVHDGREVGDVRVTGWPLLAAVLQLWRGGVGELWRKSRTSS